MTSSTSSQTNPTHPYKQPASPAATPARNAQLPPLTVVHSNWLRQNICEYRVSSELADACGYKVDGPLPIKDSAVQAWLRRHSPLLINAEKDWNVDRRAIAGVIAWEALCNVMNNVNWVRSQWSWGGIGYGPGKVHADDVAVDAEQAGYLKQTDESSRRVTLATLQGGITYIAAIMRGSADLFTCRGKYPPNMTYWNPFLLAFCYHGWRFAKIREKIGDGPDKWNFENHKKFDVTHESKKHPMVLWITRQVSFLEAAVGKPADELTKAKVVKLKNFRCEFAGVTKPCAQQGCPHLSAR